MEKTKAPRLAPESIIYLMLCSGGVLAFLLLVTFPSQQALRKMDHDIVQIKNQIEEQRILQPVFNDLLKQIRIKIPAGLQPPQKAALGQRESERLTTTFKDITRASHLRLKSITPDINTIMDDSGRMKVDLEVAGNFLDLRHFLLRLIELPYLEHIESVVVETAQQVKQTRISMWMLQAS